MPKKTKIILLSLLSFAKIYQWGKCGPRCCGGGYWFKQRECLTMPFNQYLSKLTDITCTSQIDKYWFRLPDIHIISPRINLEHTLWAFLLSALWFCKYIRLKLDTMTGTGKAITRTPLREHKLPTIFPGVVFGTMSPYLKTENKHKNICTKIGAVQSLRSISTMYMYLEHLNDIIIFSI